ncbi:prolipoprotein diacylglyceryl transferase [Clostridium argentinense CDC 2741]|uniref:Phosphatidylglycerol--prolipoprotein diacylglyceryl transferase n=1 Tax=Clostridium argentinense CDC 2741 TaxID=1418104 RepID=A0A0C1U9T3_9CLOT|nr:prolipoprotein diacylglyceryl transferase [Clostridium argentinense]ARC83289.1 prolipoprotein diacylglyceryl transferase [Clostridium argentinense]KIE48423.1 prolipoprotein diacylglyceryl transferase [Clostridium argentinense CDC 2741]NFF41456.1 prolipoprotein diacylglyceryl transferase [Clostridium argentinense]NFP52118.1 prolipoprotein diacylglyceryl transferase [Clostridium argentinense]NFP74495.1 prolipoprotein diacylglyceryl transferase [Clostridium argentinense]
MDPVAFSLFGIDIAWYGISIALGVVAALLLAQYTCKLVNINYDDMLTVFLITFPIAIVGARLYYVIFEFDQYRDNLMSIFNIRKGGLAIHGGIIAAVIVVAIYCNKKKINFFDIMDMAAPCIILAQGIGRWGNFFNQEAHGGPVTEAFISKFPQFIQKGMLIKGTYYHPTFLYESIWNVLVCLLLLYMLKKVSKKGVIFFSYIGLYSVARFFIEGLRTDSLMLGSIRMAQLVSIIGVVIWVAGVIYCYKFNRDRKLIN